VLVEIKPFLRKNTLNRLLEICNGYKKNVYFISFKESNLVKIRGITKDFKLGLILHSRHKNNKINQKLNKNHINFFVFHTQFLFISKIKKIQKKKYFYTFKNIRMNDAKSNYIIENILK
jgi:glycerophosphoryl diester phosphodiesterase